MPEHVVQAANSLKYRDFLTVVLILKDRKVFDDNWIYIHDPEREGRPESRTSSRGRPRWSPIRR